jgi:hypothetical protein
MSELNDDPYKTAEALGLDVVLPEPNELFIDLDDPADELQLQTMLDVLNGKASFDDAVMHGKSDSDPLLETVETKRTTSKSGNTHVYLKVSAKTPLSDIERIALQACLGSDRKRELLSALRILLSLDRPATVFFETKPGPPVPPTCLNCTNEIPEERRALESTYERDFCSEKCSDDWIPF